MAAGSGAAAGGRSFSFKVVLLGEGCVGKTSLVLRYCENKFNDKHITTLQVRSGPGAGGGLCPHLLGQSEVGKGNVRCSSPFAHRRVPAGASPSLRRVLACPIRPGARGLLLCKPAPGCWCWPFCLQLECGRGDRCRLLRGAVLCTLGWALISWCCFRLALELSVLQGLASILGANYSFSCSSVFECHHVPFEQYELKAMLLLPSLLVD